MNAKPNREVNTHPEQFIEFHELLTSNAPIGYIPYYFAVTKQGKDPVPGISWKKNRKTYEQAIKLLEKGFNIGIAGTDYDSLCIMDVDDMRQVPKAQIKPTLEVTSRKRIGRHYYYFSPNGTAKKNIPTGDAGELRTVWQYVLAPGSYVPCGEKELENMPEWDLKNAGYYTVSMAHKVSSIEFDELPNVYRLRQIEMEKAQAEAAKKAAERVNRVVPQILTYRSALWDLNITDVSGMLNTGFAKVAMPHEIHGSETGHNCSVNKGLLHCWRHNVSHSALSYLAVLAGIGSCEQLGKPHGGGSFGVDYYDGYTIFKCWLYAKEHNMIPEDDPIPHAALVYYALSRKICKKSQIVKGRLPDFTYMITPKIAMREGINLGRK